MNKKYIQKILSIALVLLMLIVIPTACNVKESTQVNNDNQAEVTNVDAGIDTDTNVEVSAGVEESENTQVSDNIKVDYMELIKQGKIDTMEFSLGENPSEVLSKMGEPIDRGWFVGSEYIYYDNISFFFNDYVFAISMNEGRTLYGIELGKTSIEDVKNALGEPTREFQDVISDEDEFSSNDWKLIYEVGKYRLEFYCKDNNSPVYTAYYTEIF